ncbi:HEPN domain-containing protein [Geodermatophilus nigrescens]
MLAYNSFRKTLDRVQRLIDAHGTLHGGGPGRPQQQAADVLRAAVVLTVAALDAFVGDVTIEAIPELARKGRLGTQAHTIVKPQDLLAALASADPALELQRFARSRFARTTLQSPASITNHLDNYLGYTVDWAQIAGRIGVPTPADAQAALGAYVERRHGIAHAGDVAPGRRGASPINKPYVERGRDVVAAVAGVLNTDLDAHIL